jgi:hypothetical protein
VFHDADEFTLNWMPTLHAMWSPKGQQVLIPTPGQPHKRYSLGAVNYHAGETVVLCRRHKRRLEVAELLQALVNRHPRPGRRCPMARLAVHYGKGLELYTL